MERAMFRSITALLRSDTARIEDHLTRLCADDRSLRFAAGLVIDATIRRCVAAIPFERDLVMGLVSQRDSVFGLVHGCVFTAGGRCRGRHHRLQLRGSKTADARRVQPCRHDTAPRGRRVSCPWPGQPVDRACSHRQDGARSLLNRLAPSGAKGRDHG